MSTKLHAPGRVTRWRLTEPVRFYLAGPLLVSVILFATLAVDRHWLEAVACGFLTIALYAGIAAARLSVFCEPSHYTECRNAALKAARGELIP